MSCSFCRRTQEDKFSKFKCNGIETVDECRREYQKVPKLSEENERFSFLLHKILPVLCDGYGGFRHDAIAFAIELYGIPENQRPIIYDRCLTIVNVIQEIREIESQRRKNG